MLPASGALHAVNGTLSSTLRTSIARAGRAVEVNGTLFHVNWIRERSRESSTCDLKTLQPTEEMYNLPLDLTVKRLHVPTEHPEWLDIEFSDGLSAWYHYPWLEAEAAGTRGVQLSNIEIPAPEPWNGEHEVTHYDFNEVLRDFDTKVALCGTLLKYGVCVVHGIPPISGSVLDFAGTVGYVRHTNWGDLFNVQSAPDEGRHDLAYTAISVPAHVDNPYRNPPPGVQILHCIVNENEEGAGASTAVDGFYCAERLRESDPEGFALLTKVEVRWENNGGDGMEPIFAYFPHIQLDNYGNLQRFIYSTKSGGYAPALDIDTLDKFYAAKRKLGALLNDPSNEIRFTLNSGDTWVVDNTRVLHGRTGFPDAMEYRHMQGCYIDMDRVKSIYLSQFTEEFTAEMNETIDGRRGGYVPPFYIETMPEEILEAIDKLDDVDVGEGPIEVAVEWHG